MSLFALFSSPTAGSSSRPSSLTALFVQNRGPSWIMNGINSRLIWEAKYICKVNYGFWLCQASGVTLLHYRRFPVKQQHDYLTFVQTTQRQSVTHFLHLPRLQNHKLSCVSKRQQTKPPTNFCKRNHKKNPGQVCDKMLTKEIYTYQTRLSTTRREGF